MLADRLREADGSKRFDQVELESTLGGSALIESDIEPAVHARRAVLAPASVPSEVLLGRRRRDQAEVPTVLGGPAKPAVIEPRGEVVEHPVRLGGCVDASEHRAVTIGVVPTAPANAGPRRQSHPVTLGDRREDLAVRHLSQAVQSTGRRAREKAELSEVERDGGAPRQECVG